jgi:hypothetical protein
MITHHSYDQTVKEWQGTAHDALYDAMRSSWNTWQALQAIRQ